MRKPPDKERGQVSGRVAFDERGNAVWQWRVGAGVFTCDADTARIKALQEGADVRLAEEMPAATQEKAGEHDPYRSAEVRRAGAQQQQRRRTLDDMRKLSEEIMRIRKKKPTA